MDYYQGQPLRSYSSNGVGRRFESLDRGRVRAPANYHFNSSTTASTTGGLGLTGRSRHLQQQNQQTQLHSYGAGDNGEMQRYIRVLERDLDTLRSELQVAREKAHNPELVRELRDLHEELKREQQMNNDLEHQVSSLNHTVSNLEGVRDDFNVLSQSHHEQQRHVMDLEKEVHTLSSRVASAEDREQSLVSQLNDTREHLQHTELQLSEARGESVSQVRENKQKYEAALLDAERKHSTVVMELSSCKQRLAAKEKEVDMRSQTIESLQQRLSQNSAASKDAFADKDRVHSELRATINELEQSLRRQKQESDSHQRNTSMRDATITSLEEQKDSLKTHNSELHNNLSTLQATIEELNSTIRKNADEIASLSSQVESGQRQVETLSSLRDEAESRCLKHRENYTAVSDILLASETQLQCGLVSTRAKDVMDSLDSSIKEVAELKSTIAILEREAAVRTTTIAQLEGSIERERVHRERMNADIEGLREELLGRTKELKEATLGQEMLTRETRTQEEKLARYEGVIEEKDKQIEDMHEVLSNLKNDNEDALTHTQRKINRLELTKDRELARLKNELMHHKDMNRNENMYAEVFMKMGRLLQIDPDLTASTHANNILRNIEQLKNRVESAENDAKFATQRLQEQSNEFERSHLLFQQTAPVRYDRPATSGHFPFKQNTEEIQRDHDEFRHSVARLIHCSRAYDDQSVIDSLKEYVKTHLSSSSLQPSPPRSRRGRNHHKNDSLVRGRSDSSSHDVEKLKRKLDTALKTIESQDMWIDSLNQGDRKHNMSSLNMEKEGELQSLRAEVSQLRASQRLASGGTLQSDDVLAFRNAITDLERRLQKHITFRSKIIQELGLSVISASDHEILTRIKSLVSPKKKHIYT
eukprot:m.28948 g.28948  ORF g.28948 m.28948 type:complete len:878 (+) comp6106_c0_seq1:258-2891(+)